MQRTNQVLLIKNFVKLSRIRLRYYCDIIPSSQVKLIRKSKKKNDNLNTGDVIEEKVEDKAETEFRVNEYNIQMISKNIYEQLFKNPSPKIDPNVVKSCQDNLQKHGIDYKQNPYVPDVELKLPELCGKDVVEHFYNIGEQYCSPYRDLLKKLATCSIPPLPKKWSKVYGWSKYSLHGVPQPVSCPPDNALILDVEVLMSAGKRPTLACAVTSEAWYGWVSTPLANGDQHKTFDQVNYEDLIPLETDGEKPCGDLTRPRIVVGHNVSYDRAKIKEQYWLEKTGVRFMDTMSMHTCVSGVTSYQRTVLKTKNKEPDPTDDYWIEISSLNSLTEVHKLYCGTPIDKETRNIFVDGTLEDVHENFQKLMTYCANDVVATHNILEKLLPMFFERFPHPVTLTGMLELGSAYLPVNSNWLQYIDSAETIFEDMKLESKQILSQKADEACKLMENEAYKKDLWMWDQDWSTQTLKLKKTPTKKKKDDVAQAEKQSTAFKNRTRQSEKEFEILCDEYIEAVDSKCFQPDLNLDVEALSKKFAYLYDLKDSLPVKRPYLAGYPAWYRKLCTKPGKEPDWEPGATNITTSMQITPKLLRLSWEGYPLHHVAGEGWGFLVPFRRTNESEDLPRLPIEELLVKCPVAECKDGNVEDGYVLPKTVEEDLGRKAYYARKKYADQAAANQYHGLGVWCGIQLQGCCHFLRLPHKDGPKYKVGNPLARDFLDMFSQNVLSAQGNDAEKVLSFGRMMSYWRNNRERIMGQQVVWLPQNGGLYGAILPQVVVCGTLTRRASEPTWMTASNAQKDRIGSELRAMVQAPPGYKFVGADVDSQELWIAALLGDSSLSGCGSTALGWAVLAGDKARRSDLHSLTARAADISRSHAKVINYARIYGAGQSFAERLLKQFNPTMTMSEAKSKAAKMYATTKGRRVYVLKKKYREGMLSDGDDDDEVVEMTSYQATRLAKMSGKRVEEMFERPLWVGGTESEMFNKLEEIAGAGQSFAERLLKQFNPTMTMSEAKSKAAKMYATTKGRRVYVLKKKYREGMLSDGDDDDEVVEMTSYQATRLAKMSGKRVEEMFERPLWVGGTESEMFNKLEEIADSPAPSTAFLAGRLSRALEHSRGRWAGTRLNWCVQSAAADFLHLMLASMAHSAPAARFCLSFHDEVRYLVPEEKKCETALALQITNLLTRAFCSQRVGINDLPLSVAFFTAVDVDQVLRKEADLCCTTPSNPHGLEKGYGIPSGESLNIHQVIEKCRRK